MRVHVLQGDRLGTLGELYDFLAEFYERDPADWALTEFQHGGTVGFIGASEAFWLAVPGVAVNVLIDRERLPQGTLQTITQRIAAVVAPEAGAGAR
ncbi:hypothetical protein [Micromonospora sp. NPDC023888]|uniref:hypothetical protein n=1 Tax=Micromonospora sp. NPDC023888 TaxID=3155607 RepID=UPI0033D778A5